ncbi:MAG: type II toxin-antitoxin system HicB family antitoxin [Calditrichaeota bacterium]|nr:type II toxin-antitoxin system HicB family antitoxin [Calditrichota bacterium]
MIHLGVGGPVFIGCCPEISGANGQCVTREDCRANLLEATDLVLEMRAEDGQHGVPQDAEVEQIPSGLT